MIELSPGNVETVRYALALVFSVALAGFCMEISALIPAPGRPASRPPRRTWDSTPLPRACEACGRSQRRFSGEVCDECAGRRTCRP